MAIGIEAQALFQQLNQHVLHHLIAVFIGFAVFYLIALWGLRRSVSRPLQALVEETLALEQGRLRQHTPVSGTREFVELIYRFRRIMQERNDSVSALYDSKQRLRSTLQRLSELINNSPLGIVEWDNRLHAQR